MSKYESHSSHGNVGIYRPIKTLVKSTFDKVQLAINSETNDMVAMKVIDNEQVLQQNMSPQVKKEIAIIKQLQNPHVVQVKEVVASRTKIFIIMEYMSRGELRSEVASRGGKLLSEDAARIYFRQMIQGLQYMHSHGVYHCDLKLQNLLLDSNGNIKISNYFGLHKFTSCRSLLMSKVSQCTANYVAPEQLACNTCVGKTTDVWSCGVILYYLLAGYFPFEDKNLPFVFQNIRRAKFTCPSWFSEDAKLLLSQILVKNPNDRITLERIQDNAWFNKGFESEAPSKHTPITVTEEQLCNAVTSADVAAPSTTPPMLNAFDLMSCAGGLALDNLFNYHRGSHASWKRFYHFESDLPVDAIIEDIKVVMRTTGMATLQKETPTSMVFHVKRKKQHTDIHVDISPVLSGLHIVTMRCAKGGHAITYYKFMSEIGSRILYRKRLV